MGAAQLREAPVGEQHLQRHDVVGGHPVLEAVRAARVLGYVPPQRAGGLTGRVGRVLEAMRKRRVAQARVHHPRLDHRAAAGRIDPEDAVQSGEGDEHALAVRQRPSGEAGTRTARDPRHA